MSFVYEGVPFRCVLLKNAVFRHVDRILPLLEAVLCPRQCLRHLLSLRLWRKRPRALRKGGGGLENSETSTLIHARTTTHTITQSHNHTRARACNYTHDNTHSLNLSLMSRALLSHNDAYLERGDRLLGAL